MLDSEDSTLALQEFRVGEVQGLMKKKKKENKNLQKVMVFLFDISKVIMDDLSHPEK